MIVAVARLEAGNSSPTITQGTAHEVIISMPLNATYHYYPLGVLRIRMTVAVARLEAGNSSRTTTQGTAHYTMLVQGGVDS